MLLKGKVAIVTGGTRGIGAAIVKKFAKEGCNVVFTFNKSRHVAAQIAKQTKGKAKGYRVDVRDYEKMKKLVSDVKSRFKRLDILVNNAGIVRDKPLMMMEQSEWHEVIDTNLTGCFNATRCAVVTFMKQKGGSIINIASLAGLVGIAGQTNYAASKGGVMGFTKALAKEVGPYNVRINAIAPGFIQTDMLHQLRKEDKERMLPHISLNRFGTPEEVAELALFLATDRSSYITAQTLVIDGGLI